MAKIPTSTQTSLWQRRSSYNKDVSHIVGEFDGGMRVASPPPDEVTVRRYAAALRIPNDDIGG
jgi:hypothetical protein